MLKPSHSSGGVPFKSGLNPTTKRGHPPIKINQGFINPGLTLCVGLGSHDGRAGIGAVDESKVSYRSRQARAEALSPRLVAGSGFEPSQDVA